MSPRINCDRKSTNCKTVDLPDPFRPTRQVNLARGISKSTSDLKLLHLILLIRMARSRLPVVEYRTSPVQFTDSRLSLQTVSTTPPISDRMAVSPCRCLRRRL